MPETLDTRMENVERRLTALEELPARIDALTVEVSQLRTEVRASNHEIRGEMRTTEERLRGEMQALAQDLRTEMRILHEDVVARISLLGEALPRRAGRRKKR